MHSAGLARSRHSALPRCAQQFWHRLRMDPLSPAQAADPLWLSLRLQQRYHCSERSAEQQVAWFFAYFEAAAKRD